jgi:beta-galactosidase/beta-glucuronidase
VTFEQTRPAVDIPSLWHPDHPMLCRAVSTVSDGTAELDTFTTASGSRWGQWTTDDGFWLDKYSKESRI